MRTDEKRDHLIDRYVTDAGKGVDCYVTRAGYFKATFETASGDEVERSAQTLSGLKEAIDVALKIERPKVHINGTLIDVRNGRFAPAIIRGIHGGNGNPRVEVAGEMVKWDEYGPGWKGAYWHKDDVMFVPDHVEAAITDELVARNTAAQRAREAEAAANAHFIELAEHFAKRLHAYRTYGRSDLTTVVEAEATLVEAIGDIPATMEKLEADAVAGE